MDFQISKDALLQSLYFAQSIADRKASMPILANVLLRTTAEGTLILAATDLNMTVSAELACTIKKQGGITVAAKHFYELIKSLPNDEVHIRRLDNQYAEIKSGKVQYKLVGLDEKDFPKLPDVQKVIFSSIESNQLKDLIDKTFFSISTDDSRYHLNGAFLESDVSDQPKIRMVSTDGHRLSKAEQEYDKGFKANPGVIIPRKGIAEIRRALEQGNDQVEVGVLMGHFFLRSKGTVLSIKLNDAQFPPYAHVIPKEFQKTATLSCNALLDALKRAVLMTSDRTFGIRLLFSKEGVRVEADNPDLGQIREEVLASYAGSDLAIGFNARYLIDILQQIQTTHLQMQMNGELDPVVVQPCLDEDRPDSSYVSVVMPMRI